MASLPMSQTSVKARSGLIEDLNQKYLNLLEPFAQYLKLFIITVSLIAAYAMYRKEGIPNERVFILDSAIDPKRDGKDIVSALSLKAN